MKKEMVLGLAYVCLFFFGAACVGTASAHGVVNSSTGAATWEEALAFLDMTSARGSAASSHNASGASTDSPWSDAWSIASIVFFAALFVVLTVRCISSFVSVSCEREEVAVANTQSSIQTELTAGATPTM